MIDLTKINLLGMCQKMPSIESTMNDSSQKPRKDKELNKL